MPGIELILVLLTLFKVFEDVPLLYGLVALGILLEGEVEAALVKVSLVWTEETLLAVELLAKLPEFVLKFSPVEVLLM